jgi:hypothetical protein
MDLHIYERVLGSLDVIGMLAARKNPKRIATRLRDPERTR